MTLCSPEYILCIYLILTKIAKKKCNFTKKKSVVKFLICLKPVEKCNSCKIFNEINLASKKLFFRHENSQKHFYSHISRGWFYPLPIHNADDFDGNFVKILAIWYKFLDIMQNFKNVASGNCIFLILYNGFNCSGSSSIYSA